MFRGARPREPRRLDGTLFNNLDAGVAELEVSRDDTRRLVGLQGSPPAQSPRHRERACSWRRHTGSARTGLAPLPYAGRTTTFVLTGVRLYRWIMSWLSSPTQPLVMPDPIDSGSLEA